MQLLNHGNTKTRKSLKKGWKTFGIHLAPNILSGFNTCKNASAGCAAACLNSAGYGAYKKVQDARIAKTQLFFRDKKAFMAQLIGEIETSIRRAKKNGLKSCFRLNLTSDIPWENVRHNGKTVFELFPQTKFYDYTASLTRMEKFLAGGMPKNYHLTFSRKENTPDTVVHAVLQSGGNVAVVFHKRIPKKFFGAKVVDGDDTDLRFLDGKGKVIGLKEKGRAKKDLTGFVLDPVEGGKQWNS